MSQGIHTGGCHNGFRQFADHLGIQNYVIRDHTVVDNSLFGLFLRNCNDGIAGCLRTSTASGRNHNRFDLFSGQSRIFQKISDCVVSTFQHGTQLCGIHNTSAADSDDQVTAVILSFLDDSLHILVCRFCCQIINHFILCFRLIQYLSQDIQKTGTTNSFICKYNQFFCIFFLNDIFNIVNASFSSVYTRRNLNLISHVIILHFVSF